MSILQSSELGQTAARVFIANDDLNQLLIENLEPSIWTVNPPGKVRTAAAIFTHIHNVRVKWVRLTAPHMKRSAQLNRFHCTPEQARAALKESAARCAGMLAEALSPNSRIAKFHPDGWARAWPVGVEMLCYMISHEAHHRGQVCILAHQLGFKLPNKVTSKLWTWGGLS